MAKTTDNPKRIINAIFNDKQIKFLTDNEEEINRRYNQIRQEKGDNYGSYAREQFKKMHVPLFSSKKEFMEKFSRYSQREVNELWNMYNLEFKAVVSGMEEEKRTINFFTSFVNKGYEMGSKNINKRLNIIKSTLKKNPDKLRETYDALHADFPKFKDFYMMLGMKSNSLENEIIDKLDRIINTFRLTDYDEDMRGKTMKRYNYTKRASSVYTEEEFENYSEALDAIDRAAESNPYASALRNIIRTKSYKERKKMGLVSYGDNDVTIHGQILDSYSYKNEVYKELSKRKLYYSKSGKPYMHFIKSSIVNEWIENKKKNE